MAHPNSNLKSFTDVGPFSLHAGLQLVEVGRRPPICPPWPARPSVGIRETEPVIRGLCRRHRGGGGSMSIPGLSLPPNCSPNLGE